jgi:hypothetical protein
MANTKRPKAHPVAAKLAKAAKDGAIVALEGYVGESEPPVIRLHRALGVPDYTDIPEDAVLHVEDDIDTTGRARIWVKGSAQVQVFSTRRADAQADCGCGDGSTMALRLGGRPGGFGAGGFGFFGDMWRCLEMATWAYNHCLRTNPRLESYPAACDDYAREVFRQCMAGERKVGF